MQCIQLIYNLFEVVVSGISTVRNIEIIYLLEFSVRATNIYLISVAIKIVIGEKPRANFF